MVLLALFTHWPAVATLVDSLYTTPRGRRPARFVGIENYERMISDPIFWKSFQNNVWYALGTIPTSVIFSIVMAIWVNDRISCRSLVRLSYFTPTMLPMIAVANIWLFFYTPQYGLLEKILFSFGIPSHNWLGSEETALICMIIVTIWKEAGFFMIFYLAALQGIPASLAEASAIEGASRWTYIRRILLPLLMPTTLFVLINAAIGAFRTVDHIMVMTRGGPSNSSIILLYYIYETGFHYWDSSYAAVLTTVLLTMLATISLIQYWIIEKRVHYR